MAIKESELILNPDGSIYHLNLKPEHISNTIILVGDPDRVEKVTTHFDRIEFTRQKREFKTQTGFYKGQRMSVVSTGIGPDNIDIVINELDALFNIDFKTRQIKDKHSKLNLVRIGTSGSIQQSIPVDSYVLSDGALDLNGMLHFYKKGLSKNHSAEQAFISQTNWHSDKAKPIIVSASRKLVNLFENTPTIKGLTATSGGFYGPQGRVLRLPLQDATLNSKMTHFNYNGLQITNLEMETAAIYGLSVLLGHDALSLNAIIANRVTSTYSKNPTKVIEDLISFTLETLSKKSY